MSYFVCPDCGGRDELFGHGGGDAMAIQEHMDLLGRIPIQTELRRAGDEGMPLVIKDPSHPASVVFTELARRIVTAMPG